MCYVLRAPARSGRSIAGKRRYGQNSSNKSARLSYSDVDTTGPREMDEALYSYNIVVITAVGEVFVITYRISAVVYGALHIGI